jgi:hypothetical protein
MIWRQIVIIKTTSKSMKRGTKKSMKTGTKKSMRRRTTKRLVKKTTMIKMLLGRSSYVLRAVGKIVIHPHRNTTII